MISIRLPHESAFLNFWLLVFVDKLSLKRKSNQNKVASHSTEQWPKSHYRIELLPCDGHGPMYIKVFCLRRTFLIYALIY